MRDSLLSIAQVSVGWFAGCLQVAHRCCRRNVGKQKLRASLCVCTPQTLLPCTPRIYIVGASSCVIAKKLTCTRYAATRFGVVSMDSCLEEHFSFMRRLYPWVCRCGTSSSLHKCSNACATECKIPRLWRGWVFFSEAPAGLASSLVPNHASGATSK